MHNTRTHIAYLYSPAAIGVFVIGMLVLIYISLLAVVMNYAALTVEFSQSVRNEESMIAKLEWQYLAAVSGISKTDYINNGYALPLKTFVRIEKSTTALR